MYPDSHVLERNLRKKKLSHSHPKTHVDSCITTLRVINCITYHEMVANFGDLALDLFFEDILFFCQGRRKLFVSHYHNNLPNVWY